MITYKQIKKAINDLLISNFKIPVNSQDVEEGFIRPSFFVEFSNLTRYGLESQIHKSVGIRIYFFPTTLKNSSLEILEVQEKLGEVFDTKLKVEDRFFNILETSSEVVDKTLQFEFEFEFEEGREVEDSELMQALKYNYEVTK